MTINVSVDQGVQTIEIARPERKNALTIEMYDAIAAGFRAAIADDGVRAVLLTGQPGIFCSGNDVEDFLHRTSERWTGPMSPFMAAMIECDKPVIAAVTGAAVGIGVTMLLHCDLIYAAEDAKLSMPFTALGVVPEFASSYLLPRLLGRPGASERLLLGTPFTGREAAVLGIVNAALPADQVLPHARAVARRFTELPPGAVRATKRLLRDGDRAAVVAAVHRETDVFRERLASAEAKEAFTAFLEKRKPRFG